MYFNFALNLKVSFAYIIFATSMDLCQAWYSVQLENVGSHRSKLFDTFVVMTSLSWAQVFLLCIESLPESVIFFYPLQTWYISLWAYLQRAICWDVTWYIGFQSRKSAEMEHGRPAHNSIYRGQSVEKKHDTQACYRLQISKNSKSIFYKVTDIIKFEKHFLQGNRYHKIRKAFYTRLQIS